MTKGVRTGSSLGSSNRSSVWERCGQWFHPMPVYLGVRIYQSAMPGRTMLTCGLSSKSEYLVVLWIGRTGFQSTG